MQPFASLAGRVGRSTPRLLINREAVGTADPMLTMLGLISPSALDFDAATAYRDVFCAGDCDSSVRELARLLGFGARAPAATI